ncbi:MAG: hypothetical protein H7101_11365 [Deinococcales bacterium]|nr:hypothetical protein [Chitinophagaceae bacterium]
MKNLILSLITITLLSSLGCSSCKKETPNPNNLPPITQTGSNTFGCVINGVTWTPRGVRGTGNLSIDYDAGFNQGIFNIVAYNFKPAIAEQLIIGVRDSLNFINAPKTLILNRQSLYSISYNQPCDYFNQLSDVESNGTMTILKLDRINRIISGNFNATLIKQGCDTIKITDGRFDMKF